MQTWAPECRFAPWPFGLYQGSSFQTCREVRPALQTRLRCFLSTPNQAALFPLSVRSHSKHTPQNDARLASRPKTGGEVPPVFWKWDFFFKNKKLYCSHSTYRSIHSAALRSAQNSSALVQWKNRCCKVSRKEQSAQFVDHDWKNPLWTSHVFTGKTSKWARNFFLTGYLQSRWKLKRVRRPFCASHTWAVQGRWDQ